MESSKGKSFLFSLGGVAAVLVISGAANLIANARGWRLDATENKIFTLSNGTRQILDGLEPEVTIRFYATRDDNAMPVMLRSYAERVEDLLREYESLADGMLDVQVLDARPDPEVADSAALDGVPPQQIDLGSSIYFGLSFTCIDQKSAIPFLSPERENLLEYDITRAISEVSTFEKRTIGLMSSLDVLGSPASMMMNPAMAPQQQEPWIAMEELQSMFEVEQLEFNGEPIPGEIDVLVLVHPAAIDEATEFQIDQFLLRGGQLIAFLDPQCLVAQQQQPRNSMMPQMTGAASDLPNLLEAWGLRLSSQVVADPVFRTVMARPGGAPAPVSGVLSINPDGLNPDDVVTSQMDSLLMVFAGAFEGEPETGLEATRLVYSSAQASLVDRMAAQGAAAGEASEQAPLPLALRLSGTFSTAFPDGRPAEPAADEDGGEQAEPAADAGGESGAGAADDFLTRSEQPGSVVLVGDVDMLFDNFAVESQNILGQRLVMPINGNLSLFLNSVELLAGDSELITIRSRGAIRRPFTVVREMEAEAEARYRDQIARLEDELNQTQQRLAQLQQVQPEDGKLLLTPEQEEEIRKFEQRRAEVRNELKKVRRELRQDVEQLQARIKWANILGMPLIVVAIGAVVAVLRNRKTRAK